MESTKKSFIYDVNGHKIKVVADANIHRRLQTDYDFATDYFNKIINDKQLIEENGNKENNVDIPQPLSQDQPSTSSQSSVNARWTDEHIKLLLDEYLKRVDLFRRPEKKKKSLWQDISDAFKKKNIFYTSDELDSKLRNMKVRYKEILRKNDSRRTTGAGRSTWPWMSLMAEIFKNDDSVHLENVQAIQTADLQPPKPIQKNNGDAKKRKASESSSDSDDSESEEDRTKKLKKRRTYSNQLKMKNKIESKKVKVLKGVLTAMKEANEMTKKESEEKSQLLREAIDAMKMRTKAIRDAVNAVRHQ